MSEKTHYFELTDSDIIVIFSYDTMAVLDPEFETRYNGLVGELYKARETAEEAAEDLANSKQDLALKAAGKKTADDRLQQILDEMAVMESTPVPQQLVEKTLEITLGTSYGNAQCLRGGGLKIWDVLCRLSWAEFSQIQTELEKLKQNVKLNHRKRFRQQLQIIENKN